MTTATDNLTRARAELAAAEEMGSPELDVALAAVEQAEQEVADEGSVPECPSGCGCRWYDDADRRDCACDGPCCTELWEVLPNGEDRPERAYV